MLVGALLLAHAVVLLALILVPSSESSAILFGDIAGQMSNPDCATHAGSKERLKKVTSRLEGRPPLERKDMESDEVLNLQLANALGTRAADVALFWEKGSAIRGNRVDELNIGGRRVALEQAIFLKGAIFARLSADGWCVREMPPPGFSGTWQWRTVLIVTLSLLTLLPLSWLFARRLAKPIHDFGVAADRIGHDSEASPLEQRGPREVRVATRALNEMQARIQRQLKERTAMVAAIAHDLRTPLSRIAFRVETAPDSLRDPVQRDIAQMKDMITATIDHSRTENSDLKNEAVDLRKLLSGLVDVERSTGRDVTFHDTPSACIVNGDPVALRRLFQNLIDNACKFGPPADVHLTARDGSALVIVADQGPGIPEDQVDDLFLPFFRGERSRNRSTGGVGLGLSIVRKIADQHGGTASLHNRDAGGLAAEVRLPLHPQNQGSFAPGLS
ncbi:MAG: HAMP domain-containing protein [Novosphingobium sp.]|nr:HAMP domain-containing protein [Novosphingobium sp.]